MKSISVIAALLIVASGILVVLISRVRCKKCGKKSIPERVGETYICRHCSEKLD